MTTRPTKHCIECGSAHNLRQKLCAPCRNKLRHKKEAANPEALEKRRAENRAAQKLMRARAKWAEDMYEALYARADRWVVQSLLNTYPKDTP